VTLFKRRTLVKSIILEGGTIGLRERVGVPLFKRRIMVESITFRSNDYQCRRRIMV
jgi:hypothetical protein